MLLLLNTTKTMNLSASVPSRLKVTEPCQLESARPVLQHHKYCHNTRNLIINRQKH